MLQRRRLRQEFPELTIDEIMTDPTVRDLLRVDHVDIAPTHRGMGLDLGVAQGIAIQERSHDQCS
jgi:hypothetical protein